MAQVFPAEAGVNPEKIMILQKEMSIPRRGGGEPDTIAITTT